MKKEAKRIKILSFDEGRIDIEYIDNDLHSMQKFVDGFIEPIQLTIKKKNFYLIVDEEGKLKDKDVSLVFLQRSNINKNFYVYGNCIVGKCFLCKRKYNNFETLDEDDIEMLLERLHKVNDSSVYEFVIN